MRRWKFRGLASRCTKALAGCDGELSYQDGLEISTSTSAKALVLDRTTLRITFLSSSGGLFNEERNVRDGPASFAQVLGCTICTAVLFCERFWWFKY